MRPTALSPALLRGTLAVAGEVPEYHAQWAPETANRVPINGAREGSHGLGVGGAERPVGGLVCAPQLVACP